jgi:hypothetical protein
MKQINIFTLMIAFTCLFSACKKEDATTLIAPAGSLAGVNSSVVNFNIATKLPAPGGLIQWTDGYLNANQLIFNATHENGNALSRQIFETSVQKHIPILSPAVTPLGSVQIPQINCYGASFTIGLGSLENVTASGSESDPATHSFFLSGSFYSVSLPHSISGSAMLPGHVIPVQVIIDGPVELNTIWLNNILINQASYSAVIEFNLDQLTNGITADMMNNTIKTGNTIFITKACNQNLYQVILNNLQDNITPVQFEAILLTAAAPAVQ